MSIQSMKTAGRRLSVPLFMLAVLLIGFFIFYDGATEEAEAERPLNVYFSFEPPTEYEATYRKGNIIDLYTGPINPPNKFYNQSGKSQIRGYVYLYRSANFLKPVIIVDNIRLSSDHPELTGSVFPQSFDFPPIARPLAKLQWREVTLTVQISKTTKYSTGPNPLINLTVTGDWISKYDTGTVRTSGTITPYPLYVNVKPYHQLIMTYDPPMLQLNPGQTGYIDCIVINQGNGYERVELILSGLQAFAKSGWIIELETTVLNLDPGSEDRIKIKITSPREFKFKWHRTMINFPMYAKSYYSEYQVEDLDLQKVYESQPYDIQVQLSGFDILYVPYMWAVIIWVVVALILFNVGINPLVMRKRRLPRGKEPGFIALYNFTNSPERRERWKRKREQKKKLRLDMKEQRAAEKARERERRLLLKEEEDKKSRSTASKSLGISSRPSKAENRQVLDLKPQDDDFDIEIPDEKPVKKAQPLLSFGKPKKKDRLEDDMLDVLEHLDD